METEEPVQNGHVQNGTEENRVEDIIELEPEEKSANTETFTTNGHSKDKGHVEVIITIFDYILFRLAFYYRA